MTKLNSTEANGINNACARLRETQLGTHIKSLEDFVNQGVLATRANDVTAAINELYGMIVNNDCAEIQIPPPGFFTIFGDDSTGKLKVYYNDEDHPPLFRHVDDSTAEDDGTLYLYIADPEGDNNFEMEIGQYIAVSHLNDYYTKTQCDTKYPVTVEKQQTAESGYAATYVLKQNNAQVSGVKINIPKDFLVKSGSVKTCTTANNPVQGYVVGDKYLDFVVNTKGGDGTDEHIYILVKDLVDVYTADNSTLQLSNANQFSVKNGGITNAKHSNSITAQTTAVFKKIKYDSAGHITQTSDVAASDLPSNIPTSKITGLATVATSGSYNDLLNKPTIPPGVTVVDTVQDGNANAVSSNAVYDYIDSVIGDLNTYITS
ncbi:MAG: hypothetical protein K6A34_07120 [Methanobrevibacter sp.]|nr:hypothetical protein [Methanobrevibacter sp.]